VAVPGATPVTHPTLRRRCSRGRGEGHSFRGHPHAVTEGEDMGGARFPDHQEIAGRLVLGRGDFKEELVERREGPPALSAPQPSAAASTSAGGGHEPCTHRASLTPGSQERDAPGRGAVWKLGVSRDRARVRGHGQETVKWADARPPSCFGWRVGDRHASLQVSSGAPAVP